MTDFLVNASLWTLALYGLFEIIKTIIYIFTYTNMKADGIYLIIAAKNQEDKIEYFLRSSLFKILYGREDYIKQILVADLDSADSTLEIAKKLSIDYDCIKTMSWRECKDVLDSVNDN